MQSSKIQLTDEMVERLLSIPTKELLVDLVQAKDDMRICRFALSRGVLTYGQGKLRNTLYRLIADCGHVAVRKAELSRRGVDITDTDLIGHFDSL